MFKHFSFRREPKSKGITVNVCDIKVSKSSEKEELRDSKLWWISQRTLQRDDIYYRPFIWEILTKKSRIPVNNPFIFCYICQENCWVRLFLAWFLIWKKTLYICTFYEPFMFPIKILNNICRSKLFSLSHKEKMLIFLNPEYW